MREEERMKKVGGNQKKKIKEENGDQWAKAKLGKWERLEGVVSGE